MPGVPAAIHLSLPWGALASSLSRRLVVVMMQSYQLVEVAGLVSAHARSLVTDVAELSEQALTDYWISSRCRFDSWGYDLRAYAVAARRLENRPFTDRLMRLAVEVEASEVLARVIACLGIVHDQVHHCHQTAPITSNVLLNHRETSLRLDAIIASRSDTEYQQVGRFRSLRSRLRAATDLMVGGFLPLAPVSSLAHNAAEAIEEGGPAASRYARGGEPVDWSRVGGLLEGLRGDCASEGPNAAQNQQVAAAAMGLFDPELFDSYGLLRSTWLRRMERVGDETTVLLEEWLASDSTAPSPPPGNRLC